MIKPPDRLADSCHPRHRRFGRPSQQHHGDSKRSRRSDLAVGGEAAAVLCHDHINRMREEQGALLFFFERTAGENVSRMRDGQCRFDRIDASDPIMVMGRRSKVAEFLSTQGEEHISRLRAERTHGLLHALNFHPLIARHSAPRRPRQRDNWGICLRSGAKRMRRDRRCIWMSGINQCADLLLAHILDEPGDPAEAAAPHGYRLRQRRGSASGQRQGRLQIAAGRHCFRELARLGRASKNEDAFSHVAR
jgi:hypothetical protein